MNEEQPDDCADIFQKDYAKYVKEWSDDTMPITARERDAYAAGWKDAWQHKRESVDECVRDILLENNPHGSTDYKAGFSSGLQAAIKEFRRHYGQP